MSHRWDVREMVAHNVIARIVLYYGAIAAAGVLAVRVLPAAALDVGRQAFRALTIGNPGAAGGDFLRAGLPVTVPGLSAAWVVAVAVIAAFVLALPVAWTYMWTRQKKGYRQSVVQSLVLLPVVVAGVVVLVKSNVALAFSLAGIVAAVRFRTSLDDSKDAVFIFFATGLGLAAGVQVDAAAMLSMLFVVSVLLLWYTDFASMPPGLEDERARRQLDRAMAIANRTSQFVARIDREVLQAMAPAQLDALESRVQRRRSEAGPDVAPARGRFSDKLSIAVSDDAAAREVIEPIIESHCRRWSFEGANENGDDGVVLEYLVAVRKSRSLTELLAAIERDGAPYTLYAKSETVTPPVA